jgi:dTDP-4-amino-4,6-dideoxygalactose transaminase
MAERGIGTAIHYQPIPPELTAFRSAEHYPAAERLRQRAVSLPFDSWLSDGQADDVCAAAASASSSRS